MFNIVWHCYLCYSVRFFSDINSFMMLLAYSSSLSSINYKPILIELYLSVLGFFSVNHPEKLAQSFSVSSAKTVLPVWSSARGVVQSWWPCRANLWHRERTDSEFSFCSSHSWNTLLDGNYFTELSFIDWDGFAGGRDVVGFGIFAASEFVFAMGEMALVEETAVSLVDEVTTEVRFVCSFLIHL